MQTFYTCCYLMVVLSFIRTKGIETDSIDLKGNVETRSLRRGVIVSEVSSEDDEEEYDESRDCRYRRRCQCSRCCDRCDCCSTCPVPVPEPTPAPVAEAPKVKKYFISSDKANWLEAWRRCDKSGKRFATIRSTEENEGFEQAIRNTGKYELWVWLAANDMTNAEGVMWVGGGDPKLTFTKWGDKQPSNIKGRCVEVMKGYWYQHSCNDVDYYACEYY